jgi:hypothetical protein
MPIFSHEAVYYCDTLLYFCIANAKHVNMKPIDFPQSTKVLQKPSEMTDKECSPLPVWSDGKQCVSCWKTSFIERLKILFTGKVWLGVMSGMTQPPVFVSGESVFVKPSIKARFYVFVSNLTGKIANAVKGAWRGLKS